MYRKEGIVGILILIISLMIFTAIAVYFYTSNSSPVSVQNEVGTYYQVKDQAKDISAQEQQRQQMIDKLTPQQ